MTQFRRVVTATDEHGRSVIGFDDCGTNRIKSQAYPGLVLHELWSTLETPATAAGSADQAHRPFRIAPAAGGSVFRTIELPPDDSDRKVDAAASDEEFGLSGQSETARAERHHTMHRTDTIDYLIVLSGEMSMMLDDGEVHLKAGDCVIQRATAHGFSNRSAEYCVFAAVLIDAGGT